MTDIDANLVAAFAGRYTLERELGRGGMAIVYLARDLKHQRPVALKLLHREVAAVIGTTRFLREIEIAARLNHPHILPVLDSGTVRLDDALEVPWYVMPYMRDESLRDRLRREERLPVEEALRLCSEVAEALAHAHAAGIAHRDIKPENILLSGGHAVVTDFGVARTMSETVAQRLTSTGMSIGTPGYMSPEQTLGRDVDGRSDVYSLACVLYESLAGELPFTGASAQIIVARQMTADVPSVRRSRSSVSERVERALIRALAKDPADRFATATGFANELGVAPAVRSTAGRARVIAVAAVVLFAVTAVGLLVRNRVGEDDLQLDRNVVAIAPFEILANDAELDLWREGAVDLLSRSLDGAGSIRSVSASTVIRRWAGRGDRESALRLAQRTGAGMVVTGQLVASGRDSLRLVASLLDAASGSIAADYDIRGLSDRADLLVDSLTVRLLGDLAQSSVIQTSRMRRGSGVPLPALKAFLQGEQLFRRASWDSALVWFERAATLDTTFAFALYRAGVTLGWLRLNSDSLSREYRYRAAILNRGLPPRDSLLIHADSLASALYELPPPSWGERRRLIEGIEAATRRYPDDPEIWVLLGEEGFHHGLGARMSRAAVLAAFDRAIELDSSFVPAYVHAISLAHTLGGKAAGEPYVAAYLARAPAGFQSDGIRLARDLMSDDADRRTAAAEDLRRIHPQGLFEAWAASLWADDTAMAAVLIARELVGRQSVTSPQVADPVFRAGMLSFALLLRGQLREVARDLPVLAGETVASLALAGGLAADSADHLFAEWLSERDPRSVHGLEWWTQRRDTAALRRFARLCEADPPGAPCFGTFGGDAAEAYSALANHDSAVALRRFEAMTDTLCPCSLHRLTIARLLDDAARYDDARERLEPELEGLADWNGISAMLWMIERGRNAEARGDTATAAREFTRVTEMWRNADPELVPIARAAADGQRRAAGAR